MADRSVLVVQHLEPEGPASLGAALAAAGCALRTVRVDLGEPLPADLAACAGLVVMGGPMSARSDAGFPTRRAEIDLLRDALARGVPALGVCLGAQLLAVAGGAQVRRGPAPEIGWGPVRLAPGAAGDPLFGELPPELTVLHWHGETFDLPDGAVHLASSPAYPNQAFRLGPAAWGLQFHVEVDAGTVAAFASAFPDEAPAGVADDAPAALAASADARLTILRRFATLTR